MSLSLKNQYGDWTAIVVITVISFVVSIAAIYSLLQPNPNQQANNSVGSTAGISPTGGILQ